MEKREARLVAFYAESRWTLASQKAKASVLTGREFDECDWAVSSKVVIPF
jgi:hypothetical protein